MRKLAITLFGLFYLVGCNEGEVTRLKEQNDKLQNQMNALTAAQEAQVEEANEEKEVLLAEVSNIKAKMEKDYVAKSEYAIALKKVESYEKEKQALTTQVGEQLTVIFNQSELGPSIELISDDPTKMVKDNVYPGFWWAEKDDFKIRDNAKVGVGSLKIWPKLAKDLPVVTDTSDVLGYFLREGYTLTGGYQRVDDSLLGEIFQDVWFFSKPDVKK
ncbi:hypothetical protein N9E90_03890 [Akkermansiaceae bacterium]|nr:hypothetical protein [Akkermansiaceae bacterium]